MKRSQIIKHTISYYQGADTTRNPMKLIIENGFYSQDLIDEIRNGLESELSQSFLDFDLWLNKKPQEKSIDNSYLVYRSIIGNNRAGLRVEKYIKNFHEADLTKTDFLDLLFDSYRFHPNNTTVKQDDVDTDTEMLLHKDFPEKVTSHVYELTQDDKFLPEEAKDIFLF